MKKKIVYVLLAESAVVHSLAALGWWVNSRNGVNTWAVSKDQVEHPEKYRDVD